MIKSNYFENLDKIIDDYLKQIEKGTFFEKSDNISNKIFKKHIVQKITFLSDFFRFPHESKHYVAHTLESAPDIVYSFILPEHYDPELPYSSFRFKTILEEDYSENEICHELLRRVICNTKDYKTLLYRKFSNLPILTFQAINEKKTLDKAPIVLCRDIENNVIAKRNQDQFERKYIKADWLQGEDAIICFEEIGDILSNGKNFIVKISKIENIILIKDENHVYYEQPTEDKLL